MDLTIEAFLERYDLHDARLREVHLDGLGEVLVVLELERRLSIRFSQVHEVRWTQGPVLPGIIDGAVSERLDPAERERLRAVPRGMVVWPRPPAPDPETIRTRILGIGGFELELTHAPRVSVEEME